MHTKGEMIQELLVEDLGMRRICAKLVLRSLTDEPKNNAHSKTVKTSSILHRPSHTLSVTSLLQTSTGNVNTTLKQILRSWIAEIQQK
jgi:hypothetical protein